MRYWREWILLNPQYTLGNNFITANAYKCIELNAHSLIVNLLALRDHQSLNQQQFAPWLLGSQSCEKVFRTARSLTPMFSTILNFGVLGFLQRLHRIHIQHCLEGQSQSTGICYPHREVHKKKDGHQNSRIQEFLSNDDIYTSVQSALQDAKDSIKALGMDVLLQQHKKYENPPLPVFRGKSATHDDIKDEDGWIRAWQMVPQKIQRS